MGHEMIFHAWKRFVMLEALSKGTHWGWMAWRSWHYTWPQTEKWEQDQSHQLCGTLKGDAKKTNLGGRIWDHQAGITYPALADTVQRTAAACFPQQKPLPCLALYQHFWVSPPQWGSTPSCLSRVRACLLLEVHLALSPLHVPLGWQCWTEPGAESGSCSRVKASLHSFQPSPLQSQRLLCSALELQSSWGQSLGLAVSCWGSRSLQPSEKRSLNAAYLEKAQAGEVSLPQSLHKRRMLMHTPLCCLPASFSHLPALCSLLLSFLFQRVGSRNTNTSE